MYYQVSFRSGCDLCLVTYVSSLVNPETSNNPLRRIKGELRNYCLGQVCRTHACM